MINIKGIVGVNCITQSDGKKVFDEIVEAFRAGDHVVLDFEGVNIYASPFFNAALGKLYDLFTVLEVSTMEYLNIRADGRSVIEHVMENAREYYSKDQVARKDQDDIIEKAVSE